MWTQVDRVLRQATTQIADQVANFLPGLVVALLLIVITVVAAVLVRALLLRALRGLEFDRWAERSGLGIDGWSASGSPAQSLVQLIYWAMLFLGLLVSLTALNATMLSELALSVFEYLPHLVAGLLILFVGSIAARFVSRAVLIEAVNMQMHSARLISLAAKWLVLLVAGAMALDHLGIGRTVMLLAFGILFGGITLAAALALGLGARDAVRDAIATQQRQAPGRSDSVDHV